MTHRLFIIIAALALVGCAGSTRKNNNSTEPSATESIAELTPLTAEELAKGIITDESGMVTATPELLAKINIGRYTQYGLTGVESLDPFVVVSNEEITLKDPETANGGLNGIRFEGWEAKEWLCNNYIRSVRLYLDAYYIGLVKNEAFDKHKDAMRGKFAVCHIEPFIGGGAWLYVAFVEDPSFSLRFWVYSFVREDNPASVEGYDVRSAEMFDEPIGLNSEELKAAVKEDPNHHLW